jgi:MFS family permease
VQIFTIIWFGQLVSTIGSYMTEFALILWAWNLTGSATALALVGFFSQLPRIPITLVAGIIVDRYNRKHLMMLGDVVAALSTVSIGLLYFTDSLQIWHLYLVAAVSGGFGQIQRLAYSTSIAMIVPKLQYTRANSMDSAVHYGSAIIAPALAGILYPQIGLPGILSIDLITFGVAIATLLAVQIPQPQSQPEVAVETIVYKLTFGFRHVWRQPGLRALLMITALFWFAHDLGEAVYDPMILARTGGSATILGSTASAAGIGGVTGAVVLSAWGGPKRRVHGMLLGFIGAGISKTMFGLGRSPLVWIPAQFCSSLNFPLLGSSETAIWMEKIAPEIQGRVFAANMLVIQGVSAIAFLVAGPLADHIFEPVMQSSRHFAALFSPTVGTGIGAGMALLYILASVGLVLVGFSGYVNPHLQTVEEASADSGSHID